MQGDFFWWVMGKFLTHGRTPIFRFSVSGGNFPHHLSCENPDLSTYPYLSYLNEQLITRVLPSPER